MFFEVEEHTRESSEQRHLTSMFKRVRRGDRSKIEMSHYHSRQSIESTKGAKLINTILFRNMGVTTK